MKEYADLVIVLFVIVFYGFYFMCYNSYCNYRNHNKVREIQIREKRQVNFYDAKKIKDSIKDRLFMSAFLHILPTVIGYSFVEKKVGDNLFFSTGLVFSVVILLTGMIVKKRVSKKIWNSEYQYMISEDTEMSKQEKFNRIMSEQEQKNVFIVAAIACAFVSWPLCSPKLSGMFLAVLVGGVVWFETDIKKLALEILEILISFIKDWHRLMVFLIPTAITVFTSRIAKDYIADSHTDYCLNILGFIFFSTIIIWSCILRIEADRKRYLDHEWKKI